MNQHIHMFGMQDFINYESLNACMVNSEITVFVSLLLVACQLGKVFEECTVTALWQYSIVTCAELRSFSVLCFLLLL